MIESGSRRAGACREAALVTAGRAASEVMGEILSVIA